MYKDKSKLRIGDKVTISGKIRKNFISELKKIGYKNPVFISYVTEVRNSDFGPTLYKIKLDKFDVEIEDLVRKDLRFLKRGPSHPLTSIFQ